MREFLSEVFINTWHIMLCSICARDFEDLNEVLVYDDHLGQDQLTAATMSDWSKVMKSLDPFLHLVYSDKREFVL